MGRVIDSPMTDSPQARPDLDPLSFDPVLTGSTRHDGWTPERQRRFIAVLAVTGVVTAAARAVGKSATSAYKLRDRPGAEQLARAWDTALLMAGDRAYEQAIDRAINGVEVPRFYKGRQVATVRRPDYRMALKVLDRHLAPTSDPLLDYQVALGQISEVIPLE